MGAEGSDGNPDARDLRNFMRSLLRDVWALETMLHEGRLESGVERIGAEQETVLIKGASRPAGCNMEVLEALKDGQFTTELARFNVELNLTPLPFHGDCLSKLEHELESKLKKLREVANARSADVVLTGILPTLRLEDLSLDNMTPRPRYRQLNDALTRLRGEAYEFRIAGTDELLIKHDSVMTEACNTSFQVHLQTEPRDFARFYNIAQAIAAPVLAAATNSPILFGRRLWQETRIAVFQQAVDTRSSRYFLHERSPRVSFGRSWVRRSPLELFQEDIARYRVLLDLGHAPEDPFAALAAGRVPKLAALQLHNSTVYRWNRPCYGVYEGKPHLRIENRVLPSGPSTLDEVANAAFWLGLMKGMAAEVEDITQRMDFAEARANFLAAARQGLGTQVNWLDKRMVPVSNLILDELLPAARRGLAAARIEPRDADRYLGVIEGRVRSGQTGSRWMLESLRTMGGRGTRSQQMAALTATSIARQQEGKPVHEWPLAKLTEGASFRHAYSRVEQIMTTDVVTVNEEELVDLVARIMDWNVLRYVPVEDDQNRMVGLVSQRALLRYLSRDRERLGEQLAVKAIMHKGEDLIVVAPETRTLEALELMRSHRVGCLPVVKDGHVVGVVTERDFMTVAGQLLEQTLRTEE